MKRLLFATTALVASGGLASAQGIALSGSAEMGVVGGSVYSDQFQFWTDVDVTFTFSGETDNGLTFGGTIDLDELNGDSIDPRAGGTCRPGSPGAAISSGIGRGGACPGWENDASVFLSGAFGTLTMGDTDGAFDWALQDLDILGDISDANTSHDGFNGNGGLDGIYDGQIARYDYSFGDFAFAVSVEADDEAPAGDPVFGVGVKYAGTLGAVDFGVGLGYQTEGTRDILGVSIDASLASGFRGILNYSDLDGFGGRDNHLGVGVFYTRDALSAGVNYGSYDLTTGGHTSGFGVVGNYDLSGGAVVQFGYGNGTTAAGNHSDQFSLGISMAF